jgi:hypothetical protein
MRFLVLAADEARLILCTHLGHRAAQFGTAAGGGQQPVLPAMSVDMVDFHSVFSDLSFFCLLYLAVLVPVSPTTTAYVTLPPID